MASSADGMGGMLAGLGAGIGLVLVAAIICWCSKNRRDNRKNNIDPMSKAGGGRRESTTAAEVSLQPMPDKRKPTLVTDGIMAVLEHKKITPFDLKKDVVYGTEVGSGAFGQVFKAKLSTTDCAIKQLHKHDNKSTALLAGLLEEFDVMMQLRHPNVLLTMGIAVDKNSLTTGIVMEYMQASLFDVIYEPTFAPYRTWDSAYFAIASDVAKGMSFIHFNGLLHRDLKPGNVLLDGQWVAKVADFGNALDDAHTNVHEIAGTPPYMAPEIILAHTYDRPVDVWAFGCIVAHMASGQIPYGQLGLTDRQQMLDVIKAGECSPLELLFTSKGVPQSIVGIAKDCCLPYPPSRPDFQAIASRFDDSLPEDNDPRPLVRIKNKKVGRTTIASAPRESVTAELSASLAPKQNESFHSTYRGKFMKRGDASDRTSPRARSNLGSSAFTTSFTSTSAGTAQAGAEESPTRLPLSQPNANFMDSFADVFLATFTPGKAAGEDATKDDEEDNEEDFV